MITIQIQSHHQVPTTAATHNHHQWLFMLTKSKANVDPILAKLALTKKLKKLKNKNKNKKKKKKKKKTFNKEIIYILAISYKVLVMSTTLWIVNTHYILMKTK